MIHSNLHKDWCLWCQIRVSRMWVSNYIPQYSYFIKDTIFYNHKNLRTLRFKSSYMFLKCSQLFVPLSLHTHNMEIISVADHPIPCPHCRRHWAVGIRSACMSFLHAISNELFVFSISWWESSVRGWMTATWRVTLPADCWNSACSPGSGVWQGHPPCQGFFT